jgi:predicted enzyme related to lactoylglutathione lyase
MTGSELFRSIGQIHISVTDIDRPVGFYRDTLGMRFLFQVPGQPMAFSQCGEGRLYLGVLETPEFKSRSVHYYRVDSIVDAQAELMGKEWSSAASLIWSTATIVTSCGCHSSRTRITITDP